MIRWCSYCQSYMGESAPLEDYSLTHAICQTCLDQGHADDETHVAVMQAVGGYYQRLREAVDTGMPLQASALVREGLDLGLKESDLAWGVLQPLLRRAGVRWASGNLSVAREHLFSSTAMNMIDLLFSDMPALRERRQSQHPDILLVMAEDNFHSLGLRMAELGFCLTGYTTFTVMPGLPAKEVAALSESLQPRVLGISVALAPQMRSVRETRGMIAKLPAARRPKLVVGGSAVRLGLAVPEAWGIEVVEDFDLEITGRSGTSM